MYEIRIHGLGGQGVVTATNVLALACFYEGWQAQAFPFFGPERTGAPVTGFVRLDRQLIKLKQQIYAPDLIIVLDDALLAQPINVTEGAKPNAKLLIKSSGELKKIAALTKLPVKAITICQAPGINNKTSNLFVLGYAIKQFNLANLSNYLRAIKEQLADKKPELIQDNLLAARLGYEQK